MKNMRMSVRLLSMTAFLLVTLSNIACITNYNRRSDAMVRETEPLPTLLGAMVVSVDMDNTTSTGTSNTVDAANAALSIMNNAALGQFGEKVAPTLEQFLQQQGFALFYDGGRALTLDQLEWFKVDNAAAIVTGVWTDPRGSHHAFGGQIFKDHYKKVADRLKVDGKKEAFASIRVRIREVNTWLFWYEPHVQVNISIIDGDGRELLDAQSVGVGKSSVFYIDRSTTNLQDALQNAILKLQSAPREMLP